MDTEYVTEIKQRIAEEHNRQSPPVGFPQLAQIPSGRYTSDAFWEAEQTQLWPKSWLLAGHAHELPNIGSSKLWNDMGVSVVIVKDEREDFRAYYNTCQHRGGPIITEPYTEGARLRCAYHGWTYNLDGDLIAVPDQRDFVDLDLNSHRLLELKCENWGNFIFVNRDRNAVSLMEFLAPVLREFEQFDLTRLHFFEKHSITICANWKACVDSFMETYHLRHIHPNTVNELLDHKGTVISLFEQGHSRMYTPNRAGYIPPQEGFGDISSVGELPRITNLAYSFFPNLVVPLDAGGFPLLLFWPIDKRTTRMDVMWFGPNDGVNDSNSQAWKNPQEALTPAWLERLAIFDSVLAEDVQFLPWQQQSMETGAITGMPLSYLERRLYHRHEAIDKMLGVENIPSAMAVEPLLDDYIER